MSSVSGDDETGEVAGWRARASVALADAAGSSDFRYCTSVGAEHLYQVRVDEIQVADQAFGRVLDQLAVEASGAARRGLPTTRASAFPGYRQITELC